MRFCWPHINMKIKSLKISNIFGFGFAKDVNDAVGIDFDNVSREGSLHILIGPNGSGKSNFIDVLSHIFKKSLFTHYLFNETIIVNHSISNSDLKAAISQAPVEIHSTLYTNRDSQTDEQRMLLTLVLNENDINNIKFLNDNAQKINTLLSKYSNHVPSSDSLNIDAIKATYEVQVILRNNRMSKNFQVQFVEPDDSGNEISVVQRYLTHFEAFQHLITIHNKYESSSEKWPQLKRTFALLGSYRNYGSFTGNISTTADRVSIERGTKERLLNESTKLIDTSEPLSFELVKRKIVNRFVGELLPEGGLEFAIEKIKKEEPLLSINKLLDEYLKLNIDIRMNDPFILAIDIVLIDKQGRVTNASELSSGEKGILHFVFSLFGYDLGNAVMVIDEPELHLHPQMQRYFIEIIKEVKERFDIQFIAATHSPMFIDTDTIDDVHRFYLDDNKQTQIKNPHIEESQKSLIEILNYTNSSKIFFVDKVILVEGPTDEYFLRFYLEWLRKHGGDNWGQRATNYEILSIGGKERVDSWKGFLSRYGLKVYFIGDWDSISLVSSFNIKQYETVYLATQRKANKDIKSKGSKDGSNLFLLFTEYLDKPTEEKLQKLVSLKDYIVSRRVEYASLIRFIKDDKPEEWEKLKASIESNYESGTYILKGGELEDYLGVTGKGLDKVIEFCENDFHRWLRNEEFNPFREELESIVNMIFDS
jgi:putative ATP-dependent endonuclease of OLD family